MGTLEAPPCRLHGSLEAYRDQFVLGPQARTSIKLRRLQQTTFEQLDRLFASGQTAAERSASRRYGIEFLLDRLFKALERYRRDLERARSDGTSDAGRERLLGRAMALYRIFPKGTIEFPPPADAGESGGDRSTSAGNAGDAGVAHELHAGAQR